jgi:hypothetical protein
VAQEAKLHRKQTRADTYICVDFRAKIYCHQTEEDIMMNGKHANLPYVKRKTWIICSIALRANPNLIRYIQNPTREMLKLIKK